MLIDFFKKPAPKRHISPRIRAYGKARIDIARRATSLAEWDQLWKKPANDFPFDWGNHWKQCVEYKVDDFAAEVGFYIDILGLPVNAFDPEYAMFTSPGGDFFLAIVPKPEGRSSTPPDAMRIQFMVADLLETTKELERRGITFEQKPLPCSPGSSLCIACFRTPHGITIDLWGVVDPSHFEPSQEEADINNGDLPGELDAFPLRVEPDFEDAILPFEVGIDFPLFTEPDGLDDSTDDQLVEVKTDRGRRSLYPRNLIAVRSSEALDEQAGISGIGLEQLSGEITDENQLSFFEADRMEAGGQAPADGIEDGFGEDNGEETNADSVEDPEEDDALYEYTYEDDF